MEGCLRGLLRQTATSADRQRRLDRLHAFHLRSHFGCQAVNVVVGTAMLDGWELFNKVCIRRQFHAMERWKADGVCQAAGDVDQRGHVPWVGFLPQAMML